MHAVGTYAWRRRPCTALAGSMLGMSTRGQCVCEGVCDLPGVAQGLTARCFCPPVIPRCRILPKNRCKPHGSGRFLNEPELKGCGVEQEPHCCPRDGAKLDVDSMVLKLSRALQSICPNRGDLRGRSRLAFSSFSQTLRGNTRRPHSSHLVHLSVTGSRHLAGLGHGECS